MARRSTRRRFLQQSAAAGAGFWAAGGVTLADSKSPNEQLNIACVGVGGKGSSDTDQAAGVGNLVAICDIDDNILGSKSSKFPKAKKYNDFRKMLEDMEKQIDAVVVSTPDHTHAVAAMMAMKMKKPVYVQKPLTHTVSEARQMRETAKTMGVATQMGNQGTASNGLRRGVEVIRAGVIGPVREAHVWTNRPVWPQAPRITKRPKPSPAPESIHWDVWLGPAPQRPYSAEKMYNGRPPYHPFNWRGWWDFGTGALGDMACHTANLAFMALQLGYPDSIVAECGDLNPETYPAWARVVFQFPARKDMVPVTFTWYEGKKDNVLVHPPAELTSKVLKKGEKLASSGSILVGEKGILYSPNDYGEKWALYPEPDFADAKMPEQSLPRNGGGDAGMKREWVAAIKGGAPAMSNFDYAALLTETILLGNVAIKCSGKKLEWDGPNMKVTNVAEANNYLQTEYRKGWSL